MIYITYNQNSGGRSGHKLCEIFACFLFVAAALTPIVRLHKAQIVHAAMLSWNWISTTVAPMLYNFMMLHALPLTLSALLVILFITLIVKQRLERTQKPSFGGGAGGPNGSSAFAQPEPQVPPHRLSATTPTEGHNRTPSQANK